MAAQCRVCFRKCILEKGQIGVCHARWNPSEDPELSALQDYISAGSAKYEERIVPLNYGKVTSLALDPIEKKPLRRFMPGSMILSVGSYGCNLKCPFCQNVEISLADERTAPDAEDVTPEELLGYAKRCIPRGNIGAAYTYNEPLVGFEYVRDCAKLIHEAGMKNVMVTNGSAQPWVLEELAPYVDAMNIDLKAFTESYYRNVLKGDFETTKEFIRIAASFCHVELTTLVIPGENDSEEEMRELSSWVHEIEKVNGKEIPLHISRFFPRSRYADRQPTPVRSVYRLADVARENLPWVYEGNV